MKSGIRKKFSQRLSAQPWYYPALTLISHALHEPARQAHRILHRSMEINASLQQDYLHSLRNEAQLLKRIDQIAVPGADTLQLWFKEQGPKILITAHLEHYFIGLIALARRVGDLGRLIIMRHQQSSPEEQNLIEFLSGQNQNISTAIFNFQGLTRAARHLRQGGHLVMTIDIPMHVGVSHALPAQCLGQTLGFPVAIAKLAVNTGATIIPGALIRQNNEEFFDLRQPFRVAKSKANATAIEGVSQRMAKILNYWIQLSPSSWLLWPQLPYWVTLSEQQFGQSQHIHHPPT